MVPGCLCDWTNINKGSLMDWGPVYIILPFKPAPGTPPLHQAGVHSLNNSHKSQWTVGICLPYGLWLLEGRNRRRKHKGAEWGVCVWVCVCASIGGMSSDFPFLREGRGTKSVSRGSVNTIQTLGVCVCVCVCVCVREIYSTEPQVQPCFSRDEGWGV